MDHILRMPDEDYHLLLAAIQRLEARFEALEARVAEVWEAIASTPRGPGMLEVQRRQQDALGRCELVHSQLERDYGGRITLVLDEVRALAGRVAELERLPERAASKELADLREERLRERRTWRESWIRVVVGGVVGAAGVVGATLLLFGQQLRHWLGSSGP